MALIEKIKAELAGNTALYSTMTDQQVADELNAVDKSVDRTSMTRQEIYSKIQSSALAGLTAIQISHLSLALADTIDPFDTNIIKVFTNIFGSGSATLTALAAARTEIKSRAEVLGFGNIENASLVGWVTVARTV